MFEEYLLYIKINCPFCIKAIQKLEEISIPHKTTKVDERNKSFQASLKEAYNHPSFPMVFGVDRDTETYTWIGGCDNLMEHLDKS